ncbi:insulinase family protein [Leptothermofonsia sichuanensis E412]|uniref:M16 family metallopeptidase n=1 Tax=Leptothermofonsia sichuanensis TaxID=2917832 RepID=UPI001CA6A175|nr:pitrilysin family protein [Leptothermofonsia sichuanensis]QZZ21859.1 insulinase family protein [Leptothermofonsia sichuanensis E412]
MSLPKRFNRYSMLGFLFSLCLTLVLVSGLPAGSQFITPERFAQDREATQVSVEPTSSSKFLTQNVRKTVLENGLTVFTKEVNTAPVVTVQVWYRVGSRNETPGISGIAHQLEHLMFKGTAERPIQFGRFFSALGSDSNAFTSYDQTAYFGTVKQDQLKALLVLEADRMKNSIIDDKELATEKRVVISELQGYENNPGYRLGRAVMKAAFPNSPYGLPVGGTKADVERFTVEQVRDYYQRYYRPDNATLIIVGNFQTEPTLAMVRETFGKIPPENTPLPPEPAAQPIEATPATAGSSNAPIILRQPGSAALLHQVYPLPDARHPDVPALQVMDYILTGGRSSRLYQALVETGLASGASGYAANLIGGGWYEFSVTASPGKDLKQIDRVLQKTLTDLREQGITPEELERAKTQFRASVLLRNRDIVSQAFQLGDDYTTTGDYRFTDRLLNAITNVTTADVQRVAQTYLAPARGTVGFFEPTQIQENGGASGSFSQTSENFSPGEPVDPAEVAKYLPPPLPATPQAEPPLPEKLTLANGLQVLLLRDRSTPTVTLSGFITAGSAYDQPQTAGLAGLTAANLMNGTQTKDALELAKTLENKGASLSFSAGREGVGISGSALASDLPTLTQVLAEVLKTASFPADELELSRQQALTALKLELDNPARLARRVFQQTVYPESHPFHVFPTEESLNRITRDQVVQFYQQHYHPSNTVLTLLGDFDPVQVRNLLNQELGTWQDDTQPPPLVFPPVPLPETTVRVNPALPGKTQSVTFLGYNGISRTDPRYYAAAVLNQILGGDTLSSRLGTEIRDRLGLTYGIYSYFQAGVNQGPFLVTMQTSPEDTERAITSTLSLLEQIRKQGVTDNEVTAAKRSLTNSYPVELADPDNLASTILMNAVYGLSINELRQYTNRLSAVTPAQVKQAITELLHPNHMVIVTAGPPMTTSGK